jgi:hypothetical protein
MTTGTETRNRTEHLLALMTKGDDLFNERDWHALGYVHHPDMIAWVTGSAELAQTSKWDGDQLIVISAFWDAAVQRQQIGLA